MVVRAVFLLTVVNAVTRGHLIVIWVVLLLFPSVAVYAAVLQVASITVGSCLLLSAPEAALFPGLILIHVRFTPEVLPVVRVLALIAHVTLLLVVEGAPDGFEMEHVEV